MRPFAIVALLLTVIGCQASPPRLRIGVSVDTMQEPVYAFMQQAMTDRARQDGVHLYWLSAEHDEARQLADVENLIAQHVDALIIHAVHTGTSGRLVKAAKERGIPVVAMDRLPTDSPVDVYVTADSYRVGQLQAEYVAKRLKGTGQVVILEGEAGNSVAQDITKGNKDALARHAGIRIVVDQAHRGWARDLALATTENALVAQSNQIHAVLANNSGMAMGAVQALEAKGLTGNVVTVGSDADQDAVASIVAGKLSADIDKMPYELGKAAYLAALSLTEGKKPVTQSQVANGSFSVAVLLTPVKLIDRHNVSDMAYRWPGLPYVGR